MKKIKSIYFIFIFFCIMIILSFAILYGYSSSCLRDSLKRVAQIQIEHSTTLLDQKIREIEIEADGILNSDGLRQLQRIQMSDGYDIYDYVMCVIQMKEYLSSRQKSNVGMSEFILYWQESGRILTTRNVSDIPKEMFELAEDNRWFVHRNEVYFSRKYRTSWDDEDDEPYLIIKMERDYMYKVTSMASNVGNGGTLLVQPDGKSLFSVTDEESMLLQRVNARDSAEEAYELTVNRNCYQIFVSGILGNGLTAVSYYPVNEMLRPVENVTRVTGVLLILLMGIGLAFMELYYHNILLQLEIITGKLKQVENGDLTAQITEQPDNEFSYVFEQFNRMIAKIRQLIASMLKEQQLRSQAELRQLQLQIHPHFLYNSLSYIVTVADKPQAVTEMAVHLSKYYRYCTQNKSMTTIGEEISYAKAYLSIMAMRRHIEYSINVSKELYDTPVIPLILQPLIENAIEHAIEERENAKHIYVKVCPVLGSAVQFAVSDDGNGLSEEEIGKLMEHLQKKQREEEGGIGLWNVNQRLINYYDESARLEFSRSVWGGLMVSFTIRPGKEQEYKNDCIDRG